MKKWTQQKIRTRLVRKGLFVTFKKPFKDLVDFSNNLSLHQTVDLFRTVLDYALFDMTGPDAEDREEVYDWLDPNRPEEFNEVCELAFLEPKKARLMMLEFVQKFFPENLSEMSCYYSS